MRQAHPEHDDSGVAWLGETPRHWDNVHLRRHLAIVNGGTPASSDEACWGGDAAWLTPDDLGRNSKKLIGTGRRSLTEYGLQNSSATLCPAGSVVVSTRAPIGHLAVTTIPAATNQGCRTLVPSESVNCDFAYYSLLASRRVLEALGKGSTFMELTPTDLGSHRIPLPPSAEQDSIASFLDRETARIDKLITMQESLIERLDEYRTALITRVVTNGLPPQAAEVAGLGPTPRLKDSGVEWLGEVPEHWSVCRLKGLLIGNDGGVWGEEPEGTGDTVVLRSTEQAVNGEWSIAEPALRQISKPEADRYRLLQGDLLVTKSSGSALHIGKTSLVTSSVAGLAACYSNFMQRLRCGPRLDSALLKYMLNTPLGRQQMVFGSNTTTGLANLNGGILANTIVPVAPVAEQQAIVEHLDAETGRIDTLRSKAELSIERLSEYRSAVISAAVTGKIDVRDEALAGVGGGV